MTLMDRHSMVAPEFRKVYNHCQAGKMTIHVH